MVHPPGAYLGGVNENFSPAVQDVLLINNVNRVKSKMKVNYTKIRMFNDNIFFFT